MNWMPKRPLAPVQQALAAIVFTAHGLAGAQPAVSLAPVATGLAHPWAVAFLPGGQFLVTERPGRLRVVGAEGQVGPAVTGVPAVAAGGQGGLLDVVTDADFARNRRIFLCYSEPGPGGNSTALARATLSADARSLRDVKVLFSQRPKVESNLHFGCRIVQAADGNLFLTLGERYHRKDDAQKLNNHLGKIVRVTPDGAAPPDNPFVKTPGALPEIWTYGHRNPQGATLGPDGNLWVHEHGPQGGDEVNLPRPGRNYGWPVITYGENYGGGKMGEGTAKPGMEQPLFYWDPSIAPSGAAFYTGSAWPAWKNSLFVGALAGQMLVRLSTEGEKVTGEERLLTDIGARIRDVVQGPDGFLYLLSDDADGKVLRVKPAG